MTDYLFGFNLDCLLLRYYQLIKCPMLQIICYLLFCIVAYHAYVTVCTRGIALVRFHRRCQFVRIFSLEHTLGFSWVPVGLSSPPLGHWRMKHCHCPRDSCLSRRPGESRRSDSLWQSVWGVQQWWHSLRADQLIKQAIVYDLEERGFAIRRGLIW